LKRLNSIDLIIGTNTFKKIFGYDDAKVDSSMGNATNRIYQITYQKNTTTQYIHQYTYDENHNIIRIAVKASGTTIEQYDYYYDGFNQLIREDNYLIGRIYKTMTYSYDLQNNITSMKTYALGVTTGTPQSEKRMFYQNTWKDQLTKIEYYVSGSLSYYQTFVYDASGNVTHLIDSRTSYANKSYQWDGRQLSNYSAYCNSLSFKYNDQGIRTQKAQSACSGDVTTNYTLDGDKVLVESRSNGITLYFTYDVDGTLLSMNYNGNEYFYITNLQGDIIELVDINGNSVVKYNYDAWGNIIYKSGGALADINPYLYRGYRYDIETGLYYLQSRYYDSAIGRFINSDGLLGETGSLLTHNMYAYGGNNPVMYLDVTGESPLLIILATISIGLLISSAIITATEIYLNQKTMNEIAEVILPDNIDVSNEVMLKAYFDQQARNYVEQRYVNTSAMTNFLGFGIKVYMRNIPIFGTLISQNAKNDIDLINEAAANNDSSISNAYNAAYLNVVGCDSYYDYFVDRVKYWRGIYDIS